MTDNNTRGVSREYTVPEKFSFGLEGSPAESEEPSASDPEPGVMASETSEVQPPSPQPPETGQADGPCTHDWLKKPDEEQTFAKEDKFFWSCTMCGEIQTLYSWQKP